MQTKVNGSSTPSSSLDVICFGRDDELFRALEQHLSAMGWQVTPMVDVGSVVLACKRGEPSVCFVEGSLEDFDTLALLVSLRSLRDRPRLVAYLDEIDGPTIDYAKTAFGIDELLVRPCGFTTLADCLTAGSPRRRISGPTEAQELTVVTVRAVGGGA